jgi:predicted AlkP superfamily phosphohydrolase/phosphomutase
MKIVVLGFDGMDPMFLDKARSSRDLPAFGRLDDAGAYSTIDSAVIPISPAAWSSVLTGTNPGKHGIYDFVTRTDAESTEFDVVSAADRCAPAMWDYLNELGYRVGVVGVPVTYPVDEFDGFVVSGFPTPNVEGSYAPNSLAEQSPVDMDEVHPKILYTGTNRDAFIDDQFRLWDAVERFHEFALTDLDWDVYTCVFKGTDDIAHVCWDEEPLYEVYERADRVLDNTISYLESLDEEYLLIVTSDHGFGPVDKTLFLNNALIDMGYVDLKRSVGTRFRSVLHSRGGNLLNAYRLLSKLGVAGEVLSLSYGDSRLGSTLEWLREKLLLGTEDIDYDRSDCFSMGNFGQIFLQDESVQDELVDDLLGYRVDGEPIIDRIYTATEEFHGDEADRAPDLMLETPGYRYVTSRGFALGTDSILTDHVLQRTADHKPTGVVFAAGDPVEPSTELGAPTLEDILPTVMAALGEPLPAFVDGSPFGCLTESGASAVRRFDFITDRSDRDGYANKKVKDQLESLGYTS